jgi:plastocyanin
VIASVTLALVSCAPPVAPSPTAAPRSTVAAPSLKPSPTATALPEPSISPGGVAAPDVNIVEPAFRPQQEWTYSPAELSTRVGKLVVWTNTGAVAHTVTADDGKTFDSGSIDPKGSFTLTPTAPGTFAYHCSFHPWMKATLVVTP